MRRWRGRRGDERIKGFRGGRKLFGFAPAPTLVKWRSSRQSLKGKNMEKWYDYELSVLAVRERPWFKIIFEKRKLK